MKVRPLHDRILVRRIEEEERTKVVRTALQNAASVASLLLTTESLVAEKPETKDAPSMPDMDM